MKIYKIDNLNAFFKVVDRCKGRVYISSEEGDRLAINSQICRYILTAMQQEGLELENLELECENPKDIPLFMDFLAGGNI